MRVCIKCGSAIPEGRAQLGYDSCLPCGEHYARKRRHTIVPVAKSNYIVVSDRETLKQLNPKRTGG